MNDKEEEKSAQTLQDGLLAMLQQDEENIKILF